MKSIGKIIIILLSFSLSFATHQHFINAKPRALYKIISRQLESYPESKEIFDRVDKNYVLETAKIHCDYKNDPEALLNFRVEFSKELEKSGQGENVVNFLNLDYAIEVAANQVYCP